MAYDNVLAERMEDLHPELRSRKMFGGMGYFLDGNMCLGIMGDRMMVRLGDAYEDAMTTDGVGPFDPSESGKGMKGWITVDQELLAEDDELDAWMSKGLAFGRTLPPK